MKRVFALLAVGAIGIGSGNGAAIASAARDAEQPETVMVTLRSRAGAEQELAQTIARHWDTARRLNLVQPDPHITVRGADDSGKPYFVDIFTWRDAAIPDAAPPEILAIWTDLNRLTEGRDGRPGLEFIEVRIQDR